MAHPVDSWASKKPKEAGRIRSGKCGKHGKVKAKGDLVHSSPIMQSAPAHWLQPGLGTLAAVPPMHLRPNRQQPPRLLVLVVLLALIVIPIILVLAAHMSLYLMAWGGGGGAAAAAGARPLGLWRQQLMILGHGNMTGSNATAALNVSPQAVGPEEEGPGIGWHHQRRERRRLIGADG